MNENQKLAQFILENVGGKENVESATHCMTRLRLKLKDNSKAKQWIEVLKAGGSKNPVDLAKMADVDITTDKPLLNTIEYIGSLIDEMERLTDKIEQE